MTSWILIADDHPAIRCALRRALEAQPEWVVCAEAANGREAVAKAEECRPDLILLDLDMPVLNGLEAAKEISSRRPGVPILLYTAFNFAQVEIEARRCGVRKIIDKAAPLSVLLAEVQAVLGTAQRPSAGRAAEQAKPAEGS